jgi:predicted helicase
VFLLIKKSGSKSKSTLNYFEFPDYTSREEKFSALKSWEDLDTIEWKTVTPNPSGDWINQRSEEFSSFIPLAGRDGDSFSSSFFKTHSAGLKTNRDSWVYNFSDALLEKNIKTMIHNYGLEAKSHSGKPISELNKVLNMDSKFMSWNEATKRDISKNVTYKFDESLIRRGSYRPFCEQYIYFDKRFMDRAYQLPSLFPRKDSQNFGIFITAPGSGHDFCAFAVRNIPDTAFWGSGGGQFFPRYSFEDESRFEGSLFDGLEPKDESGAIDNISDSVLAEFSTKLRLPTSPDQIFAYVYAVLNSESYIAANKSDLKKVLPRLPINSEFEKLSALGAELLDLHLGFDSAPPYKLRVEGEGDFRFEKLKIRSADSDTFKIVLNSKVSVLGVPKEAFDFKVGSRAPLEWLEDKFQLKVDKKSALISDPNDWIGHHGGLEYLVNLLGSLTTVGIESKRIRAEIDKAWKSGKEIK